MLFRPSYCANCGEKIERAEWYLWTSRRFCELCESQFKGFDLIPKALVGLGLLGIVFGINGYFGGGSKVQDGLATRQLRGLATPAPASVAAMPTLPAANNVPVRPEVEANQGMAPPAANRQQRLAAPEKPTVDGPLYFCGAQTKKGTPCSRKVKGNVRCYQHTGMPAMLPPDKLRAG